MKTRTFAASTMLAAVGLMALSPAAQAAPSIAIDADTGKIASWMTATFGTAPGEAGHAAERTKGDAERLANDNFGAAVQFREHLGHVVVPILDERIDAVVKIETSKPKSAPAPRPAAPQRDVAAPAVNERGGAWDRLAQCESGGNWAINTGNGYHGGLQFHPQTWTGHGGGEFAPTANQATREQQIIVAERVLATQGWGAWPACSSKLGLR